ncbi:hypothetical protein AJ80_05304 [Polytolypa hystricis UAMH7299]|uniref:Uncharacterized protein n=1 Tax=Polytolypa hystricis (strain UAMH7299) TaxID=1447883 RepID=A0A2B7Y4M5_POLH7|nr:hypothetical protein AJ80_05304 [Polytolypa hystricis UAMH7299]
MAAADVPASHGDASPAASATTLLAGGQLQPPAPTSVPDTDTNVVAGNGSHDERNRFARKSDPHLEYSEGKISTTRPTSSMRPVSPLHPTDFAQPSASPHRARHPCISPSSPGRAFRSLSPRVHSPASSQIFERSVQEDIAPSQASPSIPSHIMTENHIPPILGASSVALTDERLDPDSVEIITHSFHQPASLTVTGGGYTDLPLASSWHEDSAHLQQDAEDSVSNYGALDTQDIKRLSFVSFADLVHAEHAETDQMSNRGSMYLGALSSNTPIAGQNRSPSPVRSPVSSHGFGTSPPTSVSPSSKILEASPNRGGRGPGSPVPYNTYSPPLGGYGSELNVETMTQALRRTGSGDFSGIRSQPMSAVGNDDGSYDRPFK